MQTNERQRPVPSCDSPVRVISSSRPFRRTKPLVHPPFFISPFFPLHARELPPSLFSPSFSLTQWDNPHPHNLAPPLPLHTHHTHTHSLFARHWWTYGKDTHIASLVACSLLSGYFRDMFRRKFGERRPPPSLTPSASTSVHLLSPSRVGRRCADSATCCLIAHKQTKHLFPPEPYPAITAPVKPHTPFTFSAGDCLGAVCFVRA